MSKCATGNQLFLHVVPEVPNIFSLYVDVCSIRLDFETFTLLGASADTEEAAGGACTDTFQVTVSNCDVSSKSAYF